MNAKKFQPALKLESKSDAMESPLKFLSPFQKAKSNAIAKEWKAFNNGLFGDIINKI